MVVVNNLNKKKVKDGWRVKLVSWVIASVILLNFYFSLSASGEPNSFVRLLNAVVALICFVFTCRSKQDEKNTQTLILAIFACWGFSVLSGIVNGATSLLKPVLLFDMIFNSAFAYIMVTRRISLFPIKVAFLLISLYFAYTLLVLGIETTEIFSDSAGGMIGTTLLSVAIVIQYIDYRDNNKIPILPSIITLFLCVFSYSRASIVCALLYFVAVLFFSTRNLKNIFLRYIPFILIVCTLAYFLIQNWELIETLDMYEKFERKGVETDGRGDIWSAYLNNLDFGSVLFGITLDHEHRIMGFDNPHNIIIRLHSQFGLIAFVIYYFIIKALVLLIKKNPFIACLLFAMVLRGMFDIAYFFDVYDYIILAIIFEKQLKREKITPLKMALV